MDDAFDIRNKHSRELVNSDVRVQSLPIRDPGLPDAMMILISFHVRLHQPCKQVCIRSSVVQNCLVDDLTFFADQTLHVRGHEEGDLLYVFSIGFQDVSNLNKIE